MELINAIERCQNIIYIGIESLELCNSDWLNGVCGQLLKLFRSLQKYIIFDIEPENVDACDICFLSTSQIITCIKYLEKVFNVESKENVVLTLSRKYFLDRILWCLTRLKEVNKWYANAATQKFTSGIQNYQNVEHNFVNCMDIALELITPLTLFNVDKENSSSGLNHQEESCFDCVYFRSIIDRLIRLALELSNVLTLTEEKNALNAMCQNVLKDCIVFEETYLQPGNDDEQQFHLNASSLENSLYRLDKLVNDCLMRLIFYVFAELEQCCPIEKLRKLSAEQLSATDVEKHIESFDLVTETLIQIGLFAVANCKVKTTLRSCLASFESLDAYLVPSIFSKNAQLHSRLLEQHWQEEVRTFKFFINNIIDSIAFSSCLIDIFALALDKFKKDPNSHLIETLLSQCNILAEHFQINQEELKLNEPSLRKDSFEKFKLMLCECNATIHYKHLPNFHQSLLKRLKILLSTLKKCCNSLKEENSPENSSTSSTSSLSEAKPVAFEFGEVSMPTSKLELVHFDGNRMKKSESLDNLHEINSETENYFENNGIFSSRRRSTSIFYNQNRSNYVEPAVMAKRVLFNTPQVIKQRSAGHINLSPLQLSKRKSRTSLRIAMFKKSQQLQSEDMWNSYNNHSSFDLHITDILEKISDLSTTLSNRSK